MHAQNSDDYAFLLLGAYSNENNLKTLPLTKAQQKRLRQSLDETQTGAYHSVKLDYYLRCGHFFLHKGHCSATITKLKSGELVDLSLHQALSVNCPNSYDLYLSQKTS